MYSFQLGRQLLPLFARIKFKEKIYNILNQLLLKDGGHNFSQVVGSKIVYHVKKNYINLLHVKNLII